MCTDMDITSLMDEVFCYTSGVFAERLISIRLYGSYARGDYDDESDIDILVLVDMKQNELSEYESQFSDFSFDLTLKYGTLVSLYLQDNRIYERLKDSYPFFVNIEKDGIEYRKPGVDDNETT